jgi:hypothetical protein
MQLVRFICNNSSAILEGIMHTWKFLDRSNWSKGPWDNEPIDKAVWVDEVTGLDCMIHRGSGGAWCGYVGVSKEHKFFGEHYNEHYQDLAVHGGLTFSDACHGVDEDGRGICHPADEGDHVWWFGFDCAHSFDIHPSQELQGLRYSESEYRNKEYVISEVTDLAKQLAALS